eukprot:TRINITY_DN850_c3_g2_i1.p1 TRINITY_DN850_c3_g2~~TRINITY_DN850_c3_g2_i1.p1  ORF type:complete len:492 (+),score=149.33 TRINITY_DN850_c3_g2_i1:137-1612(+)
MLKSAVSFDCEKYLAEQSKCILERVEMFENKLYLEFGGKLVQDFHAARVLPGFDPDVKLRLLQRLKDKVEIIMCIYSGDIESRKSRADFGTSYENEIFRLRDLYLRWGLTVSSVVVTRYEDQPSAKRFSEKLERKGLKCYFHRAIPGYPHNVDEIVSDAGFGANPFIETKMPLIVVTAPGPNSGKLGTCMSQVFHENVHRGVRAGYAKFETFPIWSIPLKHPVNIAYEAATVDLLDYNEIDPFHKEAYGIEAVNYNRDVAAFPLLRKILTKISGAEDLYRSPTDMGVNRAGFAIVDDHLAQEAAKQECVRRYFKCMDDFAVGRVGEDSMKKMKEILDEVVVKPEDRKAVPLARECEGGAIDLDARIGVVSATPRIHFTLAANVVLKALQTAAGVPDEVVISDEHASSVNKAHKDAYFTPREEINGTKFESAIHVEDVLTVLGVLALTSVHAKKMVEVVAELRNSEMHLVKKPDEEDVVVLRRLGVIVSWDI